jgi:hypothetical protein
MVNYFNLWHRYYDTKAEELRGCSCGKPVVEEAKVVSEKEVTSVEKVVPTGSVSETSTSGESDVVVTSSFKKRQQSVESLKKPVAPAGDSEAKTPWRFGKKLVKTLTDRQITSYGDGACYLHLVKAERAAEVYRRHGAWLTLGDFFAIPVNYLIPRPDMRSKSVSVSKKNIHISGASNSGWSFYTVLQAAVSAGIRAPLLEGLEAGYGDLRIDPTFKLGGMVTGVTQLLDQQINKFEVSRTSESLPGRVVWSFDDKKSAVVIQVPALGCRVEEVVVEKEKTVLRVGASSSSVIDLVFPFSLTKQVIAWEVLGKVAKRLVVSVTGCLVDQAFFPYAPVVRTVVKNKPAALLAVDPERGTVGKGCDMIVVDSFEHAKELVLKGYDEGRVNVYGATGVATRVCYWPTVTDRSVVKTRVRSLHKLCTLALHVVGDLGGMTGLSGLQPSSGPRYHRWYGLEKTGAVSLAALSKVFVQSDQGYQEALEMFKEEADAGSLLVEKYVAGVDTRLHTVCVYVEAGAVMNVELAREIWCGEAREYVCVSQTEQPLDWLY